MPPSRHNLRTPLCAVETQLSDGRPVCLRTIRPSDEQSIRDGIMEMSDRSRYLRFFSAFREPPDSIVKRLSAVDGHDHIGWGAILLDGAKYPPIGAAHAIRIDGSPDTAELAVALLDDYHGFGLARMLIAAVLVDCAREMLLSLEMQIMPENRAAARLLKQLGAERNASAQGVAYFTLDVNRALQSLCVAPQPVGLSNVLFALDVKAGPNGQPAI
jgi:RimJ/RimL family protein N-acetyltransferase